MKTNLLERVPTIFHVRFSAMAGMDLGNEKQMSMNVATKVILRFSDLASAEKSVKKRTQFFPIVKRACVLVNLFSMGFLERARLVTVGKPFLSHFEFQTLLCRVEASA